MRVAIVHDYLTQRGGAERVVLAMARAFPDAPIHTSLFEPRTTFPEFAAMDVRPRPINGVPGLRRRHRLALPLLATTFSRLVVDADVVLCSSSGWAHGASTTGRKIVYCYNPARWLYQRDQYAPPGSPKALVATVLGAPLRSWDARQARTADRYLAISSAVRARVQAAYGIDADVLPPPYGIDPAGPSQAVTGCEPGFLLCVSRLLPYKNVGAVVEAVSALPAERLVVVGEGPEEARLRGMAASNVRLLGAITDAELRWLYANCRALVAASYEDFGLTPLEAATFGRPCVALRWGGFLDTVIEGRTGFFFDRVAPTAIREALVCARATRWDRELLTRHASRYSEQSFADRLRDVVEEVTSAPPGAPSGPRARAGRPRLEGVS